MKSPSCCAGDPLKDQCKGTQRSSPAGPDECDGGMSVMLEGGVPICEVKKVVGEGRQQGLSRLVLVAGLVVSVGLGVF